MAGMKDKTPVSRLLEYFVTKKIMPKFELTHNGVGTHKPEFTYRVQVENIWEEGTGRSKQEAKHRAAEKMLKRLHIIDAKEEFEEGNESFESMENYVGQLKELCLIMHYPEPKFVLEEAAGPPHSRIFKMICFVSTLQDFGISKTKKQAKHQAAYKMLQRLKEGGKNVEEALTHAENIIKLASKGQAATDEEITDKYCAIRTTINANYKDPAAFYKDHHNAYISLKDSSPTLLELVNDDYEIEIKNAWKLLQKIAEELVVSLNPIEIPSKEWPLTFTVLSISVYPTMASAGTTLQSAAYNLLHSLKVLCKD